MFAYMTPRLWIGLNGSNAFSTGREVWWRRGGFFPLILLLVLALTTLFLLRFLLLLRGICDGEVGTLECWAYLQSPSDYMTCIHRLTEEKGRRQSNTAVAAGHDGGLAFKLVGSFIWLAVRSHVVERLRVELALQTWGAALLLEGRLVALLKLLDVLHFVVSIWKCRGEVDVSRK